MFYRKYKPPGLLQPWIECYFKWQSEKLSETVWIDSPPTAFSAIVFNLGGRHQVTLDAGRTKETGSAFISGQAIRNVSLQVEGAVDQIGIVFRPTGIHKLFGVPMYELTHSRFDVLDVLGDQFVELEEQLRETPEETNQITLINRFLMDQARRVPIERDGVDYAANLLLEEMGNVQIKDILDRVFMSRRKFERHFLKQVGVSPKFYGRIRRYGHVCSLMAGQRKVEWGRLLHQVGYYDQSHFIRDFHEFAGMSPSAYLQSNQELVHQLDSAFEEIEI